MKLMKLWLPPLVWAGLIFYLSNIPDLSSGLEYDFTLRKCAHVTEYFIFTFLLYRAFKGGLQLNHLSLFLYPSVIAYIYALSDEFHQHFVAGRHGCFTDTLIDAIGILGFYLVLRFLPTKIKK
jgi:VanZ family protein